MQTDLIFGLHSIAMAIANPKRGPWHLVGTDDALRELKKSYFRERLFPPDVICTLLSAHQVQEKGGFELRERGFQKQRIPSNLFLKVSPLEESGPELIYDFIRENKTLKMMALDQVTDVHNLAAIMRTASFYDLDFLLMSRKGKLSFPPSYFRIASGAAEYIKLINCSTLSRVLLKMQEREVVCLGLAEEATCKESDLLELGEKVCFVMGAEDLGLSNATRRSLKKFVALTPQGPMRSLNVSVAAALSMEKFLRKEEPSSLSKEF